MKACCIGLIFATLAAAAGIAQAQSAIRIRGIISALDGNMLLVKTREGRDVKVELAKDAAVFYVKEIKLAEIKPGTALGTTAVEGADGKLVAREVHLFPPERDIPSEGHRPMAEPKTTMTNATVSTLAQVTNGRELTLSYKGGSIKVLVPENTPVVMPVAGDRTYLIPGETVTLTASMNNDGQLTTARVQVSRDGVRPPQ